MAIANTSYVRSVLLLDGLVSGAAGVVMAAGASFLAPFLHIPQPLLFWAGLVLLPWCLALVYLSRRDAVPRLAMIDVVGVNVLWVAASFGLMIAGAIAPNLLGIAFVGAQALTVALFAILQLGILRASPAAA